MTARESGNDRKKDGNDREDMGIKERTQKMTILIKTKNMDKNIEEEIIEKSGEKINPIEQANQEKSLSGQVEKKVKKKLPKFLKIFLILLAILAIVFTGIFSFYLFKAYKTQQQIFQNEKGDFFNFLKNLNPVNSEKDKDTGEDFSKMRENILLLGIPGEKEAGSYLTDSIIIASIEKKDGKVSLFSIPRDLYVSYPYQDGISLSKQVWGKINGIYSLYESKKNKDGSQALERTIEKTFDLSIDYYVLVDFSGFKKIIDVVGGIDVFVEKSFTDQSFPGKNNSYQVVSFQEGLQHFNGEKALQFARSRHGANGEGSDFARAKRQQEVLKALSEKILSFKTILNPFKVNDIFSNMGEYLKTDLSTQEAANFVSLLKKIKKDEVINFVPETGNDQLLFSEMSSTAGYILKPKGKNFFELKFILQNIFFLDEIKKEKGGIKIFYTDQKNLASAKEFSQSLKRVGFLVDEKISFLKEKSEKDLSVEKGLYLLNKDKEKTFTGLKNYFLLYKQEYPKENFIFQKDSLPFLLDENEKEDLTLVL